MRAISSYGQISAQKVLAPYKRYFPESDEDDDFETHVTDVLGLIEGTSSTDGAVGKVVGNFIVDNHDFGAKIAGEASCANADTLAYTLKDANDGDKEKIHFCKSSWQRGDASDVDCASLDAYPSPKIDAFSRIALHEMMHYSTVGPKSSLKEQIKDATNADDVPAYDPDRVHGLLDPDQDDNPVVTETNADSYAWMSLDAWISQKCSKNSNGNSWATYFTEDPPKYERDDED